MYVCRRKKSIFRVFFKYCLCKPIAFTHSKPLLGTANDNMRVAAFSVNSRENFFQPFLNLSDRRVS